MMTKTTRIVTATTAAVVLVLLLPVCVVSTSDFGKVLDNFPSLSFNRGKAIRWIIDERKPDYGWGQETARVVVTLQLSNSSWYNPDDLTSQLSAKQLEVDLLLALWSRNHENPLRAGRIAQFINALVATCRNPRNFHGHDVVSVLDHLEGDVSHPFEFSYVTLALCNAGVRVKKKQVQRLQKIAESVDNPHNHDTLAILVQALTCITKQQHNRHLVGAMHRPLKKLKKLQKEDGSFGNIHTSAIVIQALIPTSDEDGSWNATKAIQFLVSQQQEDGSFGAGLGKFLATTAVLPILNGHSYIHVRNTSCHFTRRAGNGGNEGGTTASGGDDQQQAVTPEPKPFTVNYSIWIGVNASDNYTLTLTMPHNVSFFEIMKQAAEMDERFEFAASLWPNGHYVHTLAGLKENTTSNHYWLLGMVNNNAEKPAFVDVGVDEFFPKDGDHIVFWYKEI